MTNITWVDTGFLVALFAARDSKHHAATSFLKENDHLELWTIWPVITESCFFLDSRGKSSLLEWIERGGLVVQKTTPADVPKIRSVIERYESISPDFTDATLVAMAEDYNVNQILTVDVRDFSIYRLTNGETFKRLWV